MEWRSTFQATIDSYPDDPETGAEACERLLSVPGLPPEIELATRRNATWYLPYLLDNDQQPLPRPRSEDDHARFLIPRREGFSREIEFPVPDGWSRFNPSIAAGPDGELLCIVRSSNYTVGPDMIYHYPDNAGGVIDTTNYVVRVGDDLSVSGASPIRDAHLRTQPPPFPVTGFEDCRLFWHEGWKFSATVRDRDERGVCQMVMAGLVDDDGWMADGLTVLSGKQRHEKNWMPLRHETPRLQFVYSCHPTIVLHDPGLGSYAPAPFIARSFRGGSQVVPIDQGLRGLALVHEAVNFDHAPRRIYQHRFVLFDHACGHSLVRLSRPFCFQHRGLEFAAGMVRVGGDLIISYGVKDAEAWSMKVPLDRVLGLLADPLPEEARAFALAGRPGRSASA